MAVFKTSKAKENILKRVRAALQEESVRKPFPELDQVAPVNVYVPMEQATAEENFAYEFSKSGGNFIFCNDEDDFSVQLQELALAKQWKEVVCAPAHIFTLLVHKQLNFIRDFNLRNGQADACITECEAAIARTGSLLFSSKQHFGRTAPIYFPVHIAIVYAHNIVDDVDIALKMMQNKYGVHNMPSMINLNTGPSRTADIEKTLVTGVHGPKEVYCFFINQ
ncbi:lactate utilization protein B/C [Taibaiella sp. KBW10]|uniref:LutC/YkgG family protein n=1 Tax=Taibaiella sp. KBW10 TaxID=2153357 RepID=UPI000F5A2CE1|nr:LUD domain-containing protein [Taibaiella sp. KBW10]RQO32290.1 lactate utilization protein B/C [Taibaiella sp. KBW10]